MKYFQFFKIYKRFNSKREKALIQQSMKKKKLRKVVVFPIRNCFTKPFKRIINQFFYFPCLFVLLLFKIRMVQEISKAEMTNS